MQEYNIYCDESCHLENDNSDIMSLGSIIIPKAEYFVIKERIRSIKEENNIKPENEMKWVKISKLNLQAYVDLINYFFDNSEISFRGLVANKTILNHKIHNQTHDEWYYKMYFQLLRNVLIPKSNYNVFIDIKDTNSNWRQKKLRDILSNNQYDFDKTIINKIQPIRSHECEIMQIVDILTGALSFNNRTFDDKKCRSSAKKEIVDLIKKRSGYQLNKSTLLRERKFNIFFWHGNE